MIIKYYEWLLMEELMLKRLGMKPTIRGTVYEMCDDKGKKIKGLSKEEAVRIIDEKHLMRVYRDESGTIWR